MEKQLFVKLSLNFNLRSVKDKSVMAIIYAVVNFKGQQFKVNTNMKVYKLNWDYRNQKAKVEPYLTKQENLNNSIANKKIIEIREKFEELKLSLSNKSIDNITLEYIKQSLFSTKAKYTMTNKIEEAVTVQKEKTIKRKPSTKEVDGDTPASLIFTKVIVEHYKASQGTTQKASTIKEFCEFLKKNGGDRLSSVSKVNLSKYEMTLKDKKWKTIKTKIGHIMSVIRKAREFDLFPKNINEGIEDYKLRTKKILDDDATSRFALTDGELQLLMQCDDKLNKREIEIRDLFILQAEMGQRVSKLIDIVRNQNYTIEDDFINCAKTEKGSKAVSIHLNERIKSLIDKYKDTEFTLFKNKQKHSNKEEVRDITIENYITREIKTIAEKAGLTRTHNYQVQTGDTLEERSDRICDIIVSHTARHTFISNRLEEGWKAEMIQLVTGQSKEIIEKNYNHIRKEVVKDKIRKFAKDKVENETKELTIEQSIREAKAVLTFFNVPAYKFVDCVDISKLWRMVGQLQGQMLAAGYKLEDVKRLYNAPKELSQKVKMLHDTFLMITNKDLNEVLDVDTI